MYSLGDISEADERVKKFYGLLPKQQQSQQQQSSEESVNYNIKANTLPRSVESASTTKESPAPSRSSTMRFYDYGNKKERSNSVSAYERLFGSSRETSLSPPESPSKQTMI